ISVRPDMLSIVLAMTAVLIYTMQRSRPSFSRCALVSLFFFLAWSVKQSTVGMLVGTSLHVIVCDRRISRIVALVAPCFVLMMGCLYLGGDVYRFNLIKVPSLGRIGLHSGDPKALGQSLITNAYFWIFPCLFFTAAMVRRLHTRNTNTDDKNLISGGRHLNVFAQVMFPAIASAAWCIFASFRDGAAKNTLLEGYIGLASYAVVLLLGNSESIMSRRAWQWFVCVSILSMAVFPIAQVAFPNRLGNLTI